MKSPRFKSVIFQFKWQQQQRSRNLSCSPDTFSVQPISRVLKVQMPRFLFCQKSETISQNFHKDSVQILMLAMMFCSDKKIRIVTNLRCGNPLNNQSSNQQFRILAYKRRHLPCIQAFWCSDQDRSLSLYFNVYVLFHVIFFLISCLCFSFSLLYLYSYVVYLCFSSSLCLAKFI